MIKIITEMHREFKLDIYVFIVNLSVVSILYIFTISVSKSPITLKCACQVVTSISTNYVGWGGGGGVGCRGRDHMEVGLSTPCSIRAYYH